MLASSKDHVDSAMPSVYAEMSENIAGSRYITSPAERLGVLKAPLVMEAPARSRIAGAFRMENLPLMGIEMRITDCIGGCSAQPQQSSHVLNILWAFVNLNSFV